MSKHIIDRKVSKMEYPSLVNTHHVEQQDKYRNWNTVFGGSEVECNEILEVFGKLDFSEVEGVADYKVWKLLRHLKNGR